jgi:hypothetical protein
LASSTAAFASAATNWGFKSRALLLAFACLRAFAFVVFSHITYLGCCCTPPVLLWTRETVKEDDDDDDADDDKEAALDLLPRPSGKCFVTMALRCNRLGSGMKASEKSSNKRARTMPPCVKYTKV